MDAILEATAQVLTARGYDGTTTKLIAERAGVSVGSLYQYFPNKDALIDELVEQQCVEMTEALIALLPKLRELGLRGGAPLFSRALLDRHRDRPYRRQALFLCLGRVLGFERVDAFLANIEATLTDVFSESEELIRPEPELAARVITRALSGVFEQSLRRDPELFLDARLSEELVILMLGYLMPEESDRSGA